MAKKKKKKTVKKGGGAYAKAGVDIGAAEKAVALMTKHIRSTHTEKTLSDIGSFAGLFDCSLLKDYNQPVLVQSIDGVGTKMMIAEMMQSYTVGQCVVYHCINDILAIGALPLTFLNYVGTAELDPTIIAKIVEQMAIACRQVEIPLIGGETAEMPGVYRLGRHDVVGCITGIAEKDEIIDGSKIADGDILIGLSSNGLHTNGYSLARKALLETAGYDIDGFLEELGCTVGEELLKIHRCYSKPLNRIFNHTIIHGIAHITGGGLIANIARLLPKGLLAEISYQWKIPPVFRLIQDIEKVSNTEMRRVFNLGIGMVLIAPFKDCSTIRKILEDNGEPKCPVLGEIKKTRSRKNKVVFTY